MECIQANRLRLISRTFFLNDDNAEQLNQFFDKIERNERNYDYNLRHTPVDELKDEDIKFIVKYATDKAQYFCSKNPDVQLPDYFVTVVIELLTNTLYDYEIKK